jgi:chromosome segregation ATPase
LEAEVAQRVAQLEAAQRQVHEGESALSSAKSNLALAEADAGCLRERLEAATEANRALRDEMSGLEAEYKAIQRAYQSVWPLAQATV